MSEQYPYHFNEGVMAVPSGFVDETTHALRYGAGDDAILLTVQRRPRTATLEEFVHADLESTLDALGGGHVEDSQQLDGSFELWRARLRHVVDRKVIFLCQVFVTADDVVLVISSTGRAGRRDEIDRLATEAATSIRLRD